MRYWPKLSSKIPSSISRGSICYAVQLKWKLSWHAIELCDRSDRDNGFSHYPVEPYNNFPLLLTAVAQSPKKHKGTNWYITAVSTVLVLLVVVALCVYAPCGCLWKRHRSEFDVNCPITASQKGMCGKCYLHSNASTKTMTYKERPHHVSVTMATNDSHHRPSSGNYSSQVNIIADGNNYSPYLLPFFPFNVIAENLLVNQDNIFTYFYYHWYCNKKLMPIVLGNEQSQVKKMSGDSVT